MNGRILHQIFPAELVAMASWQTVSFWLLAAAGVAVVVLVLLYWPKKQVAHLKSIEPEKFFEAENEARRTLVQLVGGVFVLIGLFFTWMNLHQTQASTDASLNLAAKAQITQQLGSAIEQLGKTEGDGKSGDGVRRKNLPARLGGILTLEIIAHENFDHHWQIMEILSAYIRQNAPAINKSSTKDQAVEGTSLEPDIDAAVTVIRRRNFLDKETDSQVFDLSEVRLPRVSFVQSVLTAADFSQSQLDGANFSAMTNLERANFRQAFLESAVFDTAILRAADFFKAHLKGASFAGSKAEDAVFIDADLTGANFGGAILTRAKFSGATLKDADFEGVDLSTVPPGSLTSEQIKLAKTDCRTKLPPDVTLQLKPCQ